MKWFVLFLLIEVILAGLFVIALYFESYDSAIYVLMSMVLAFPGIIKPSIKKHTPESHQIDNQTIH